MRSQSVDTAEVARLLGVSRCRVTEVARSHEDFPDHELTAVGYRLWPCGAVERWAAAHPDRGPAYRVSDLPVVEPGLYGTPERITPELHRVLELAASEASALNHSWLGDDHIALALLHPDCPGIAREVLRSFGLTLEHVRDAWVESMGDPFEPHELGLEVPPAARFPFERAKLLALELRDEHVTSEHLLLDLVEESDAQIVDRVLAGELLTPGLLSSPSLLQRILARHGPPKALQLFLHQAGIDAAELRARVLALSEDLALELPPVPSPAPNLDTIRLRWHGEKPPLAPSPLGHDPERRGPWGSGVFSPGIRRGNVLLQYRIDRDGYPVLTTEGKPVHLLVGESGDYVLDERGEPLHTVVDVPPGSEARPYRLEEWRGSPLRLGGHP